MGHQLRKYIVLEFNTRPIGRIAKEKDVPSRDVLRKRIS